MAGGGPTVCFRFTTRSISAEIKTLIPGSREVHFNLTRGCDWWDRLAAGDVCGAKPANYWSENPCKCGCLILGWMAAPACLESCQQWKDFISRANSRRIIISDVHALISAQKERPIQMEGKVTLCLCCKLVWFFFFQTVTFAPRKHHRRWGDFSHFIFDYCSLLNDCFELKMSCCYLSLWNLTQARELRNECENMFSIILWIMMV